MQSLIGPSMAPTVDAEAYVPKDDVVAHCSMREAPVFFEVFQRPGGALGVRYSAWVAWRDAAGQVRSHSWWQSAPRDTLVTDSLAKAQQHALSFAASHGLSPVGAWG